MRRLMMIVPLILCQPHLVLTGQVAPAASPAATRVATVTGGLGNTMGWIGVQAEKYFAKGRLSGFLGAGYTPSVDPGDPSGPTFAAGARGYTGGFKHRGFLALSVSQLVVVRDFGNEENSGRRYGPGLEIGYQFASRGGFTVLTSLGVGYAPGVPEGEREFGEVLGLGLGYTWRR